MSWFFANSNIDDSSTAVLTNIVTGCSKSNHTQYLSHDKDSWILLQQAHDKVKGKINSSQNQKKPHSGVMVPFEIKVEPITGKRSLYVTEDVEIGTKLWKPFHYHTFHSQEDYIKFLLEIGDNYHHLQCEVLSWTHPSWQENDMYVDVTLDEGTFIDEATSVDDEANIDVNCFAIRNIRAGEKIFMNGTDYSAAINSKEVTWLNDIRESAWKRTGLGRQQQLKPLQQKLNTTTSSSSFEAAKEISSKNESTDDANNFIYIIAQSMAVLCLVFFAMKIFHRRRATQAQRLIATDTSYDFQGIL